ncbi:PREDICTED: trypsin 3A1 [Bactrocera latifrons]|uniref:trypsin 3A1 n=1 Tax=Bactrocera latifrons TaxID=174628 RepID=UPI0008DE5660|nr:PREDICTED: trypsin 3A1 [Bactrocera latifrons]
MNDRAYKFTILLLLSIVMLTTAEHNIAAATTTQAPRRLESYVGRIVGGNEAQISQFPYQVSIQQEGVHRCGGAIYSATLIVSAAHCFELWDMPELFAVRAGSSEHERGGVYLPVRRIFIHPQFQLANGINDDIAVLALTYSLPFSANIQPIALASSADMAVAHQTVFFVSGWGTVTEDSRLRSPHLRFATVQRFEQHSCTAVYSNIVRITEGMLCAGALSGGRDSCKGDSGGPLVGYSRGRYMLMGVVSFGIGCGRPGIPGIYTRVAEYKDWIELAAKQI